MPSGVYPRVCGGNGGHQRHPLGLGGLSPRVRGKHNKTSRPSDSPGSIPACAGETFLDMRWASFCSVYPRVCGGNALLLSVVLVCEGLSPRVRGKPRSRCWICARPRSIPACAGETCAIVALAKVFRVYPRVCGGNIRLRLVAPLRQGLSPRVRGKQICLDLAIDSYRSIPACAGETSSLAVPACASAVYPRVCGGNLRHIGVPSVDKGLSPRVRGKLIGEYAGAPLARSIPACAGETLDCPTMIFTMSVYPRVCGGNAAGLSPSAGRRGLSPRVRGKPQPARCLAQRRWSIPACAGETPALPPAPIPPAVYPRVCGGNFGLGVGSVQRGGLSPRVRGKLTGGGERDEGRGSIPACAGETVSAGWRRRRGQVYPRVCGGNHHSSCAALPRQGLSPRVRGKHRCLRPLSRRPRSIPACAGETQPSTGARKAARVYPRVCGGNRRTSSTTAPDSGLSPRVRGKHRRRRETAGGRGSIPACAGETSSTSGVPRREPVYPRVCGGNAS